MLLKSFHDFAKTLLSFFFLSIVFLLVSGCALTPKGGNHPYIIHDNALFQVMPDGSMTLLVDFNPSKNIVSNSAEILFSNDLYLLYKYQYLQDSGETATIMVTHYANTPHHLQVVPLVESYLLMATDHCIAWLHDSSDPKNQIIYSSILSDFHTFGGTKTWPISLAELSGTDSPMEDCTVENADTLRITFLDGTVIRLHLPTGYLLEEEESEPLKLPQDPVDTQGYTVDGDQLLFQNVPVLDLRSMSNFCEDFGVPMKSNGSGRYNTIPDLFLEASIIGISDASILLEVLVERQTGAPFFEKHYCLISRKTHTQLNFTEDFTCFGSLNNLPGVMLTDNHYCFIHTNAQGIEVLLLFAPNAVYGDDPLETIPINDLCGVDSTLVCGLPVENRIYLAYENNAIVCYDTETDTAFLFKPADDHPYPIQELGVEDGRLLWRYRHQFGAQPYSQPLPE